MKQPVPLVLGAAVLAGGTLDNRGSTSDPWKLQIAPVSLCAVNPDGAMTVRSVTCLLGLDSRPSVES